MPQVHLPILVGLLLCSSVVAASPDKDADEHFAAGLRLYAEKDFEAAAAELKLAYQAREDQQTLFAWGQASRLAGDCATSRELLEKYIGSGANANQSRAAYSLMSDCTPKEGEDSGPHLDADPVGPEAAASASATQPGPTVAGLESVDGAVPRGIQQPWYRDWVGLSLLSVGAVGVVLGGASYADALSIESDAAAPDVSFEEYVQSSDRAQSRRQFAMVSGLAGGVCVGASAIYILMGASDEEAGPVSLQLDQNSTALSYQGRF